MDRERRIIGKLSPQESTEAGNYLESLHQEGLKPLEGELEKTPEQLAFIVKINEYLAEEFGDLGIDATAKLAPAEFHILPLERYVELLRDRYPDAGSPAAFCDDMANVAYVFPHPERLATLKHMLHEAIHLAAYKTYFAEVRGESREEGEVWPYRGGYRVHRRRKGPSVRLAGLNEAVVDRTTREILRRHADELRREFGVTPGEEARASIGYYADYIRLLEEIMQKIAVAREEDVEETWQRFKRGEFTGKMMHLRDIEKAYGKGSLKVLAALNSGPKEFAKSIDKMVFRYFESADERERRRLAAGIAVRMKETE